MGSHALLLYIRMPKLEVFLKANGRLSATWNTSLLNLLLVYTAAIHNSNCKTIMIIIYTIIIA